MSRVFLGLEVAEHGGENTPRDLQILGCNAARRAALHLDDHVLLPVVLRDPGRAAHTGRARVVLVRGPLDEPLLLEAVDEGRELRSRNLQPFDELALAQPKFLSEQRAHQAELRERDAPPGEAILDLLQGGSIHAGAIRASSSFVEAVNVSVTRDI